MTVSSEKRQKYFTVEQANKSLPLVRAIAGDIVELSGAMIDRRDRIEYLKVGREDSPTDLYSDELCDVERVLESDATRLQELVEELAELGVELKSIPEGLIDFPSIRQGRQVYLCWKYNEPEVAHWHEIDAGFSGRQEISRDGASPSEFAADNDPELN